jgi:ABC-type branched-subunit amino acid transport system ATPase component/MFS family permease
MNAWLRRITGNGPVLALLVLFTINALDEGTRDGFGVVLPEIRKDFNLSLSAILTLIALVSIGALALQVPIASMADRTNRVRLMWLGALSFSVFTLLTGLAPTLLLLVFARSGAGVGKAVLDPTHNSLLADYYDIDRRPSVFSFHRAGLAVGASLGPLIVGVLAHEYGWRLPFVVLAVPSFLILLVAVRLREPIRGAHERRAMGASEQAVDTEEAPPSFAEAWRIVWKVESLRRIWYSLPFLAASLIGFASLASLLYDQVFGLDERARGFAIAATEPAQIIGLVIGTRLATRFMAQGPEKVLRFLSTSAYIVTIALVVFALSPVIAVAIAAHMVINATLAILAPGILATLSLAIPPRARSMGFSVASLWVLPGLLILPIIGSIGDHLGLRTGMLALIPAFLVGGLIIATTGNVIADDIADVWRAAAARSEVAYERRQGRSPLLLVRGLDVAYGQVQVLFGIDLEIEEGACVALLGTNGAGKSTLLNAVCGVVEADRGAVMFDGREITHAPPNEIAALGITQVPGGKGVFPSLSVGENLRTAGWLRRRDRRATNASLERVRELFPVLEQRWNDKAGDLSGGQQQMLALGMAFLSTPKLLLIDELSLGLAPVVIAQLLPLVEELRAAGTTVILVEQSVNVALTVADTAFFLEKGEVRFRGATAELLERPEILRSVFLAAGSFEQGSSTETPAANDAPVPEDALAARAATAALELDDVACSFGGIRAVDGVSLSVAAREIVGIIGPNGAGKTTLFDVVCGYVRPDLGRVVLGERDITRMNPAERARAGLGRSFQDARLFPSLTVDETIAVACERWLKSRDPVSAALRLPNSYDSEHDVARRVVELVELLGLEAHRAKFIRELSTGTRRVVDLACLLAHRPSVILLDEPSSGIAQREAEALVPLLLRIRDQTDASLVIIEHDIPLVGTVADRLVAMDQGSIIAAGTPSEVLVHHLVVESYLGTSDAAISRSGPIHAPID